MIISASRRTDIPAFYSEWFINRIRAGYCTVPNPMNRKIVSVVSLRPEDVTAIVFWTRNPAPLLPRLERLDDMGYRYYFLFTFNNYPRYLEKYTPPYNKTLQNFHELSEKIGAGRVIWRYDPILLTSELDFGFHLRNFRKIAADLKGCSGKVIISMADIYKKTERRLRALELVFPEIQNKVKGIEGFLSQTREIANDNNMKILCCAEENKFEHIGIKEGKCIDDGLIENEFGIKLKYKKDSGQRKACRCARSRDIGINTTCLMGCEYCYATNSHQVAVENFKKHDPGFSSLLLHEMPENVKEKLAKMKLTMYNE